MKFVLLLGLLLCSTQQAFGTTRCMVGTKMGAMQGSSGLPTPTEMDCAVTDSCSSVTAIVTASGVTTEIEVGQCVLTAACDFVKCSAVKAFLPTSGIGSFENCRARCCKDGVCKDLVEDGGPPIVPYGVEPLVPEHPVPENMPVILPEHMPVSPPVRVTLPLLPPVGDQRCQIPMWNMRLEDNWNGISGRSGTPVPKFALEMKQIVKHKGYRPRKTYQFMIKSMKHPGITPKKFNGFFITLESNSTDCECKEAGAPMCPVGSFLTSRRRIAGAPVVQPGCDEPIVMDYNRANTKKSKGSWRAPDCTDAVIIMRAHVRGSDGRLYQDNEEASEHFLTKVIRPAPKKGRKAKKTKRRRD